MFFNGLAAFAPYDKEAKEWLLYAVAERIKREIDKEMSELKYIYFVDGKCYKGELEPEKARQYLIEHYEYAMEHMEFNPYAQAGVLMGIDALKEKAEREARP